jgi:4-hydroxy-tetrahydrodipicolinate synthase
MNDLLKQRGVIAAALTPWDAHGNVDLAAFDAQIDWIAAQSPLAIGVAGVEVQEYHLLESDQRIGLVRRAIERVGDVPVIAGVSTPLASRSADMAKQMADVGATAVLSLSAPKPWAAPSTSDEFVRWFTQLADESPLPIVVYSNPRTGTEPSVSSLAELAAHEKIAALKETSRDMTKVLNLCLELAEPGLAGVYTNMESLLATIHLGGHGAMVPAPGLPAAQHILAAHAAGDDDEARRWQSFFAAFPSHWMRLGLGPAVKAGMGVLGVDVGTPGHTFDALTAIETSEMAELFARWSLVG